MSRFVVDKNDLYHKFKKTLLNKNKFLFFCINKISLSLKSLLNGTGFRSTEPEKCPVGSYSREGSSECTKCPEGYYQDEVAQEHCKSCPAG